MQQHIEVTGRVDPRQIVHSGGACARRWVALASAAGAIALATTTQAAPDPPVLGITRILDTSGDGVNAFQSPYAVPVDVAGSTFVTGYTSDNAFRITRAGVVTQILDISGDGVNAIDNPFLAALDRDGNLFVSGLLSHNAFRITPAGVVTQILDAGGDGVNALDQTYGVTTDLSGNAFVTGALSDNVFRITPVGVVTQVLDASGDGVNALDLPYGISTDRAGNLFVPGFSSDNVFRVTPMGDVRQILDASGDGVNALDGPAFTAVDRAGNVFVTGTASDNVFRVTPDGVVTQILDAGGDGVNVLDNPYGVTTDSAGNVFVTGRNSDNVFRVTPAGKVTQVMDATGDGVNALDGPYGVTADAAGHVLVSGNASSNVFRIEIGPTLGDFALGTKLSGAIDAPGDADVFSFNATPGTRVKIRVKTGKFAWSPGCAIADADAVELVSLADSQTSGGRVARGSVEVSSTGLCHVTISHAGAYAPPGGPYVATTKGQFPKKATEILEVGVDGAEMIIHAVPGMVLKSVTIKALKPKGPYATADGMPSDLFPEVVSLSLGTSDVDLTGVFSANGSGKAVKGRRIPLDRAAPYVLRIAGASGSVGWAKVIAKFSVPRGRGGVDESGSTFK